MKFWAISDTHGTHRLLDVPEDIDCVIYAGDCTNFMDFLRNQIEFEDFFDWFSKLKIKHKVLIAGNHDTWATKLYYRTKLKEHNIIYLEHNDVVIAGIKLFGSPFTPTFGHWNFMKDRSKLDKYWVMIDETIDVLVTHGPPQGILDLSRNRDNTLEYCGDKALLRHVLRIKPKYHIFGHIHDFDDCLNQGIRIKDGIQFMNVSCVEDGKLGQLKSNGLTFELTK